MDVVLYRQSETLLLYVVSDSGRKRKALFYPRSGEWYVFSRNGREITETALGRRVIEACIAAQAPQPADEATAP